MVFGAARASLGGLLGGYLVSLAAAVWLRLAVPGGDVLSSVVSPLRVAGWLLTSAHAVPLAVRSAAGVRSPDAPGSIGRLSEVLGGGEDVVFSFSLLLVPIAMLATTGIVVALLARRWRPASTGDVMRFAAVAALVHGIVLAFVGWMSSVGFFIEADLAPELGLGSATAHVALSVGARPAIALLLGVVFGAAFGIAGGLSALPLRETLDPSSRVVLIGWMRALRVASATVAVLLALGGLGALIAGRAPSASLVGLGGLLFGANAVAAGVLFTHGASMAVALDAGPFTGWERVDFLNVGTSGGAAPPFVWIVALLPLAAGIVAGRFIRSRSSLTTIAIALRFGALWGLSMAVLALLLRVRVLSSFSVGSLDLGGGGAAFDPLMALVLGAIWGTAGAAFGARISLSSSAATWTCAECGIGNAEQDRFCVSCGAARAVDAS